MRGARSSPAVSSRVYVSYGPLQYKLQAIEFRLYHSYSTTPTHNPNTSEVSRSTDAADSILTFFWYTRPGSPRSSHGTTPAGELHKRVFNRMEAGNAAQGNLIHKGASHTTPSTPRSYVQLTKQHTGSLSFLLTTSYYYIPQ